MNRLSLPRAPRFIIVVCVLCAACAISDDVAETDPDASSTVEVTPDAGLADFCLATDPRTAAVEILVSPEAGEQPYLDALASADTSIDVQIYLMGYGGILDGLKAKAAAGVTVRVMLDQSRKDTNQKYFDQLHAAGVDVKWSSPS